MVWRTMPARTNTDLTTTRPEGEQRPRFRANREDTQQTGTTRCGLIYCGCGNRQRTEGISTARWDRSLHLLNGRKWF